MTDLLEMVKFVGPQRLRHTSVYSIKNQDTQIGRLYNELQKNTGKGEEEIAKELFDISADSSLFRQLKFKLKNRLINNLFLIDGNQPLFGSISSSFQNCRKYLYAAEILYAKGARSSAKQLAEKSFRMAEKFEFVDLCESSSSFLRNAFRSSGDRSKMKYYGEKSSHYLEQSIVLKKVINIYNNFSDDIMLFKRFDEEDYEYLKKQEDELLILVELSNNRKIITYAFAALCMIKFIQSDFDQVVVYSETAILKLNHFHDLPKVYYLALYQNIIKAALCKNDFQLGKRALENSRPILKSIKGLNKIMMLETYVQLAFRTKKYSEAIHIYNSVSKDPLWKKMPATSKEVWELFAAYLALLNKLVPKEFEANVKFSFKIGRFMNSATELKKDKLGSNLSFLFYQILYFLSRNDYEEVMICLDRLAGYNYRYLKKEESLRAQLFVKMLLKIQDANFHKAGVLRKSKPWSERLANASNENIGQSYKSEIIPFELHWELILNLLKNKFKRRTVSQLS